MMNAVTMDGFGCLVINNLSRSSKLEDSVFWFRLLHGAKLLEPEM